MAVSIDLRVDAKRALRQLRRIRRKSIPFAQRQAMNDGAKALRTALIKQWRTDMDERRRSFPGQVLKVRRAFVSASQFKPARVVSIGADDLLRLQIRGGTRRPRGRALFVRGTPRKQRKSPKDFRAGKYVFVRRKRGNDKYKGVLESSVRIPRRYRIGLAVRRVQRIMPRLARRAINKELRRAQARG